MKGLIILLINFSMLEIELIKRVLEEVLKEKSEEVIKLTLEKIIKKIELEEIEKKLLECDKNGS